MFIYIALFYLVLLLIPIIFNPLLFVICNLIILNRLNLITHLALARVAKNPNTSTVILGTSRPEQVLDNLKALEVIPKLTPEIVDKIKTILDNKPAPAVSAVAKQSFRIPDHSGEFGIAHVRPTFSWDI